MADTLTPNIQLTIQTIGGNLNSWGDKANDNFDLIDDKLGDTTSIVTTGGNTTLTDSEETVGQIVITGTLASNAIIIFSGRGGFWNVRNDTTGNFSLTCKVSGQPGVTVTQGSGAVVFCNGTDIKKAADEINLSDLASTEGNAWAAEVSVSDSGTPAIGAAASYRVTVAGTTTITGFDTVAAGIWRIVRWSTTRTLTHGASFVLLGAASRGVVSGDFSMFRSEGSGVWREEFASRVTGKAIVPPSFSDVTSKPTTVAGYGITDALTLAGTDQAVTGGAIITSLSLGTISSGTVTPNPGNRGLQHYTNNGAHTLAPSSNTGVVVVDITNAGSAGAITTSGFTKVSGSFATTNGLKYRCTIIIGNAGSSLEIAAMQ